MTIKKKTDWEAVEADYRAGVLSMRAIGESHGIAHNTILKRAKKEGWQRDLTKQVRAAVKDKVTRAVTNSSDQAKSVTDEDIIEAASAHGAEIIIAHRVGLAQWRCIADKLRITLMNMDVTADNAGKYAQSLNAGVDAQLKVIKGERQAYNLDEQQHEEPYEERLRRLLEGG